MKLYCPECKRTYAEKGLTLCPADSAKLFQVESDSVDPLLGQIIDERFQIERLLGRGGMGAVYVATQLSIGRKVALKLLRADLLDSEIALERFYRESKIISELTHPNIVRLIEFGQDRARNLLYLVMELVDGINLGDTLARGRFHASLALEIAYQVCGALTEPHKQGVIHRDLKPDNLLLVPISDGTLQVKVLDFGIARAVERQTQLTATGMVCGTPAYMAPEQAQNIPVDPRADLYALGVILYEMLAGAPPFEGTNSLQLLMQHLQVEPPPLAARLPASQLPDGVAQLVHALLAKEPQQRPDSARAVRDQIDALRLRHALAPVRLDAEAPREALLAPFLLAPVAHSVGATTSEGVARSPRPAESAVTRPGGPTQRRLFIALGVSVAAVLLAGVALLASLNATRDKAPAVERPAAVAPAPSVSPAPLVAAPAGEPAQPPPAAPSDSPPKAAPPKQPKPAAVAKPSPTKRPARETAPPSDVTPKSPKTTFTDVGREVVESAIEQHVTQPTKGRLGRLRERIEREEERMNKQMIERSK